MVMYILQLDSQCKFPVSGRDLNLGLWDNLGGWIGVGRGREVHEGRGVCIPMADSC